MSSMYVASQPSIHKYSEVNKSFKPHEFSITLCIHTKIRNLYLTAYSKLLHAPHCNRINSYNFLESEEICVDIQSLILHL